MGILWYNPINTPPDLEPGPPVKVSPAGVFFAIRSRPNRITVGKHLRDRSAKRFPARIRCRLDPQRLSKPLSRSRCMSRGALTVVPASVHRAERSTEPALWGEARPLEDRPRSSREINASAKASWATHSLRLPQVPRKEDSGLAELNHDGMGILWYNLRNTPRTWCRVPPFRCVRRGNFFRSRSRARSRFLRPPAPDPRLLRHSPSRLAPDLPVAALPTQRLSLGVSPHSHRGHRTACPFPPKFVR